MTERKAVLIASAYAATLPGAIAETPPLVRFCSSEMGGRFGLLGNSWMVTFEYVLPCGIGSTGGQLILFVNSATGEVTVAKLM